MMPVIRISDDLFARLQKLAQPFVDTPASVIERTVDFYEAGNPPQGGSITPNSNAAPSHVVKSYDPLDAPDLTHTRLISASVNGQSAKTWNDFVHAATREAATKVKHLDDLRGVTLSNIAIGKKETEGFQFLGDVKVSIQNVDANHAWKNTLHLARRFHHFSLRAHGFGSAKSMT